MKGTVKKTVKKVANPAHRLQATRGQASVEVVLLMIAVVSITFMAFRQMNSQRVLQNLIQSPWQNALAGMIENGAWGSVAQTRMLHPNLKSRHSSKKGDEEPMR